jgi:uncharacterized cofD-like protein
MFKWLYPGMRVKRWILLSAFGVLLVVFGSARFEPEPLMIVKVLYGIVVASGVILLVLGIKRMLRSFLMIFLPHRDTAFIDLMYKKRQLERGPRIVTVGGGTGLSVILSGLKEYTSNITAIVTVADSGGSSGRLREQFDMLPPGDIRNCLVALADAPVLMRDLFQFRFNKNSEFSGHNFGNLFITVMTQLTGDFEKAIKESSKVLAIRGQVIPSTLNNVALVAQYKDGSSIKGEDQIPRHNIPIEKVCLEPENPAPAEEAIKAINEAQIIILGPGSLYTSVIPNLLIKEITDAVVASDAIKIYVCNIMTQYGETDNYSACDHLDAIIKHSHPKILDYCIVNSSHLPQELIDRYRQEKSYPIVIDSRRMRALGYRVIEDEIVTTQDYIRHDPAKLAKIILGLIEEV